MGRADRSPTARDHRPERSAEAARRTLQVQLAEARNDRYQAELRAAAAAEARAQAAEHQAAAASSRAELAQARAEWSEARARAAEQRRLAVEAAEAQARALLADKQILRTRPPGAPQDRCGRPSRS